MKQHIYTFLTRIRDSDLTPEWLCDIIDDLRYGWLLDRE